MKQKARGVVGAAIVVAKEENEEVECIKCHNAKTRRYNYKHRRQSFEASTMAARYTNIMPRPEYMWPIYLHVIGVREHKGAGERLFEWQRARHSGMY